MTRNISFFICVAAAVITLTGCRHEKPGVAVHALNPVKVTEITREPLSIPVHSSGILLSSEELKLSFKTGGIVARVWPKEGQKVKKGQVLATLNLSEIDAQVSLAQNAYEKAERDLQRVKNLYADTVATLEQLQNSNSALNAARANLDIARFNRAHSSITAPDNGTILKQLVRENELVSPGYPVFLFGAAGKSWKVKTGLADRDVVKISVGDSAVVSFDAWPGVKFPASVGLVGEMASPGTGTYDAELEVSDMGYRFAAGFIAATDIYPSRKESFLLVPAGSVIEADGQAGYIFALGDSGIVRKIRIAVITITGSRIAITGLPESTSEIVTEGAAYLKDGEKVRVIR
jgi:membrane fusion protein, multidrug efflux system